MSHQSVMVGIESTLGSPGGAEAAAVTMVTPTIATIPATSDTARARTVFFIAALPQLEKVQSGSVAGWMPPSFQHSELVWSLYVT